MVQAVETFDGWYSLHDLRSIDWTSWKYAHEEERQQAVREFTELISKWEAVEDDKNGSHAFYKVVGQKADFIFMFLRPIMEELNEIETEINKSTLGEFLIPMHYYVSVT